MEELTQVAELIKEAVQAINRGKEEASTAHSLPCGFFFKFYSISNVIKRGLH